MIVRTGALAEATVDIPSAAAGFGFTCFAESSRDMLLRIMLFCTAFETKHHLSDTFRSRFVQWIVATDHIHQATCLFGKAVVCFEDDSTLDTFQHFLMP